MTTKKKRGRPPEEELKVNDYPSLSIRIKPAAKAQLKAASHLSNKPLARVVTDALELYYSTFSEGDQKILKALAARFEETDRAS